MTTIPRTGADCRKAAADSKKSTFGQQKMQLFIVSLSNI
jgi:hypothetical protein